MNIFMIGGTGLLGCEAATQLIKMGHKVTSVALPPLPQGAPIPEEMEIVFGDINKKSDEEIMELLNGNDVFIYAAGVDERVEFPAPVMDYYDKFNNAPLRRIFPLCKNASAQLFGRSLVGRHNKPRHRGCGDVCRRAADGLYTAVHRRPHDFGNTVVYAVCQCAGDARSGMCYAALTGGGGVYFKTQL